MSITKAKVASLIEDLKLVEDRGGDYLYALESALETAQELLTEFPATKEDVDLIINRHFPNRLATFYSLEGYEVAAVEDAKGNMWRVWADGDTEQYTR